MFTEEKEVFENSPQKQVDFDFDLLFTMILKTEIHALHTKPTTSLAFNNFWCHEKIFFPLLISFAGFYYVKNRFSFTLIIRR